MAELPHVMGHQIARPLPIGCATTRTPCRNVIFSADLFWLLSRLERQFVLSNYRTETPRRDNSSAAVSPVGPAPAIST
jgi:hypothetical protein